VSLRNDPKNVQSRRPAPTAERIGYLAAALASSYLRRPGRLADAVGPVACDGCGRPCRCGVFHQTRLDLVEGWAGGWNYVGVLPLPADDPRGVYWLCAGCDGALSRSPRELVERLTYLYPEDDAMGN
jgi:hypothetical protein